MNSEELNNKRGLRFAYQSLKYMAFAINVVTLTVLILVFFLVPPRPARFGKDLTVMQMMLLSAVTSVVAGVISARDARKSAGFTIDVLKTLPVIMGSSVLVIVSALMAYGYLLHMWGKG